MQQWRDEALILGSSRHGEQSAILHVLTKEQGKTSGYVRAAHSSKMRPHIQAGNTVFINWQARLPEQLGYFTLEPVASHASAMMQRSDTALVLQCITQILLMALPERQAYPAIYDGSVALLDMIARHRHADQDWQQTYIWWETHLLAALGFGLRLEHCALTGQNHDLTHVSPKTGRAVCRAESAPYHNRLLRLPAFMGGADHLGDREILSGLGLTGHFLHHHIAELQGKPLPEARQRLLAQIHNAYQQVVVNDEMNEMASVA